MYYVPRGGNRGGQDQFKWEDVKTDKGRECYLGHSLMAPVGRWQKKKDLQWFSKERGTGSGDQNVRSEVQAVKNAEKEAMLIALGQKVGPKLAKETIFASGEQSSSQFPSESLSRSSKTEESQHKHKKKKKKLKKEKSKRKKSEKKPKKRKYESTSSESYQSDSSDSESEKRSSKKRYKNYRDERGHKKRKR